MIKYKIDVVEALKQKGYSTYRIRKEHIMSESTLQMFRDGQMPSWNRFDQLCRLLECQPADLIEYVNDEA